MASEEGPGPLEPFPSHSLVPKKETGAELFLQQYPDSDGRGVVIAIFDTGVDPGAQGLQKTSHGERKILDLIDTTGDGDVDTSTIRTTTDTAGRKIKSLTGRLLNLPDSWNNPTGEWHIGAKPEFEFFPSAVKTRLQDSYISDEWEPKHSMVLAQAIKDLERFKSEHPTNNGKNCLSDKLELENLEAKVDLLSNKFGKVSRPGRVFDCIVFHDGHSWSAVVDTSLGEDLSKVEVMKPFREAGQFSKFGEEDQVNFSLTILDEGDTLSIVTTGGAHGTHVASIASACFPENPEINGIAPGAQIISFKIGDARLGTMETSTALIRAAIGSVAHKVDVINFSYGEASHWTNRGAVVEMFTELCCKHNIVFVSSAGNNGPALSTVGCPGGNTAGVIGVGAFVTPDMMAGGYSMTHMKPTLPYTWTSRGPSTDGDIGVCISAPGGAVTSVPKWTLHKSQLMNGTSMAAPNASGCIALLLSALKGIGTSYTPSFIKTVIENTAAPIGTHDCLSIGYGVLQIDKAHAAAVAGLPSGDVELKVHLAGQKGRGIYLRERHQIEKLTRATIVIQPMFPKKATPEEKIHFEMHMSLISTESWVVAPKHLVLWNGARQFVAEVDPRGLESGVHYAEVRGFAAEDPRGPVFRIPVTVIIPMEFTNKDKCIFSLPEVEFSKKKLHRFFFDVPSACSWAELELTDLVCEFRARITVHTVQLVPEKAFRENENIHFVTIEPDGMASVFLRVIGGYTIEVCLAQYWSEVKDARVHLKLTFHSVQPSCTTLTFNGSLGWSRIDVKAAFREEEIHPEFKLTHRGVSKRPNFHQIKPLGSRDVLPNGIQMYCLYLTYNFHVHHSTEVRPDVALLSDLLYESPYGGQLWIIFDSNKQFICAGDAYPKHYSAKLEKGEYSLKLKICHQKQTELKKLTDLPIMLHFKLPSHLALEVVASRYDVTSGPKFSSRVLKPGVVTPLYLRALPEDKIPKHAQPGDIMTGCFTFSKGDIIKKKECYFLQYIVGSRVIKSNSKSGSCQRKETKIEEYKEAIKVHCLECLKAGVIPLEEAEKSYADDIEFWLTRLQMIEEDTSLSYDAAEEVLAKLKDNCVDMIDILASSGTKVDMSSEAAVNSSKTEKAKQHLVKWLQSEIIDDVYNRFGHLLRDLDLVWLDTESFAAAVHAKGAQLQQCFGFIDGTARPIARPTVNQRIMYSGHKRVHCLKFQGIILMREDPKSTRLEEIYVDLHKLLGKKENQLRSFCIKYANSCGHFAIAAKLTEEEIAEKGSLKALDQNLIEHYMKLGWDHCARLQRMWLLRKYPENVSVL